MSLVKYISTNNNGIYEMLRDTLITNS